MKSNHVDLQIERERWEEDKKSPPRMQKGRQRKTLTKHIDISELNRNTYQNHNNTHMFQYTRMEHHSKP
jgi:hypothetical protein